MNLMTVNFALGILWTVYFRNWFCLLELAVVANSGPVLEPIPYSRELGPAHRGYVNNKFSALFMYICLSTFN